VSWLRRSAVPAIVVLVLTGLIAHGTNAATGDPVHYMMIARSAAFDHDLDLANDYADPDNILSLEPEQHALPGRDGALRPVHDIGLPVVLAPAFGMAYRLAIRTQSLPDSWRKRIKLSPFIALRQFVSLIVIAITAWLAVLFLKASRLLTGQRAWMSAWALVWTLSPPILTHGYVFFTEVPTALLVLLCYLRRDDVMRARWFVRGGILGALAGFLVLLHARNIGLVLGLTALTLWRVRREPRRLSGYAAGLMVMVALKVFQNLLFWGTWLTTPHERPGEWTGLFQTLNEMVLRCGAMMFDGAHGLLLSAPIYLLAPAAFVVLWRQSAPAARELLLLIGAYLFFILLPVTNAHGWHGGWAPAARFIVPIAPLLALPIGLLVANRRARWPLGAIVVIQILISQYLWAHPMWSWNGGEEPSAWLERFVGTRWASIVPIWPITHPFDSTSWIAFAAGAVVVFGVTVVLLRTIASTRADQLQPSA